MPIIKVESNCWKYYDDLVWNILKKTVLLLGGSRHLILHRNITWISSLGEAAYAWLLYDKRDKIQKELRYYCDSLLLLLERFFLQGLKMLRGKFGENIDINTHIVGGLACIAYE